MVRKVKVGFYLNGLSEHEHILHALNTAEDVEPVVFFNNVGPISVKPKYAMFNGTEIWNFAGPIVSTTAKQVSRVSSVANKVQNYYLFDSQDRGDVLAFLQTLEVADGVFVSNDEDQAYLKRISGNTYPVVGLSADLILEAINGQEKGEETAD